MRAIKEYFVGKKAVDGDGVKLKRCFGYYEIPRFDPYLLMDFFDSKDPSDYIKGFPWHPHRGISTITYLISGQIEHEDSMGNRGLISDGQCQWMEAGSGVLHQEMPLASDYMLGSQIWLNLAREDKMKEPAYREIDESMLGSFLAPGLEVKIIAGEYRGIKGPIILEKTRPIYLDIALDPKTSFEYEIDQDLNAFAFVVEGEVNFNPRSERYVEKGIGVLYEMEAGRIVFNTGRKPGRVLLLAGRPLREEIAWAGPIVMNSQEELDQAFRDLDSGNFIGAK